jgi:hypothetical protein
VVEAETRVVKVAGSGACVDVDVVEGPDASTGENRRGEALSAESDGVENTLELEEVVGDLGRHCAAMRREKSS